MKKVLILTLIVCFAVSLGAAAIPLTAASAAEASADPLDAAFYEAFLTFAGENYGGPLDTEIIRTPLYDIGLNALGALYSFSLYGEEGYAAVVESGRGGYEVAEMFFSGEQPYPFLPGDMNVFVRPLVYLVYNGGNYYTADTREAVDAETVAALAENAYFGSDSVLNFTSQTVSYVDKTDNEYTLAARFPNIVEVAGYSYACACIAGANIIQYYDRYSANLIAGYTPGMAIGPRYMYSLPGSATDAVVGQLYTDMGTDPSAQGTTVPQFRTGLSTYVTRAGYSVTYTSCMSGTSLSYSAAKNQLDLGRPIALFTFGIEVATLTEGDGADYLNIYTSSANHAMTAFGYRDITYTLSGSATSTVNYLVVASGLNAVGKGYLNANTADLYEALAVNIV